MNPGVAIRCAAEDDCGLILRFIRELALYEKAPEAVVATEAQLRQHGFGERPQFEALIAELDGEPAGMALFHTRFSTWLGTPTLYLEDIFVAEAARGHGVGRRLMARLAAIALERGWGRIDFSVLDWNPARGFYQKARLRSSRRMAALRRRRRLAAPPRRARRAGLTRPIQPRNPIGGQPMLEVWSWPTPNGHKVHIALEELGLEYKIIPVNIGAGDQFKPEFLKITPNHRIPAIVDSDGPGGKPFTLFESAAIMIYLSEKTGGKLIPKDPIGHYKCLEWMMFQMGGVGPMFGQWNHFGAYAPEKSPTRSSATPTRWRG